MNKNKKMKLIDLPNELLVDILELVPNRKNCYLVCQQLNDLCCMMTKKIGTTCHIETEFELHDPEYYDAIMYTNRWIKTLQISRIDRTPDYSYSKIRLILVKHGGNLKHLSLEHCRLFNKYKLDDLLKLVPNLESLKLDRLTSEQENQQETIDKSKDYNLNHLKELSLVNCFSMEEILELIPKGVITSITVDVENMITLTEFFLKQPNIKSLRTSIKSNDNVLTLPYNHYELQHLEFQYCHFDELSVLKFSIEKQPKLHSLELMNIAITDDVFDVICCLKELRIFKLSLNRLSPGAVLKFNQFKQLSELTIDYCTNYGNFGKFSLIQNNYLQVLDIHAYYSGLYYYRDISKIRENNPNLHTIIIKGDKKLHINPNIMKNFNKLKVIKISGSKIVIAPGNYEGLLSNPDLQILHLSIPTDYTIEMIRNMAAMIPNVEDLKLKSKSYFTDEIFNEILKQFSRLKQLHLSNCGKLCAYSIFETIGKYGSDVQIITMLGFRDYENLISTYIEEVGIPQFRLGESEYPHSPY